MSKNPQPPQEHSMQPTAPNAWNITRIVAAHDCNKGQIPAVNELISQLDAFHQSELNKYEVALFGVRRQLFERNGELSAAKAALAEKERELEAARDQITDSVTTPEQMEQFREDCAKTNETIDELRAQLSATTAELGRAKERVAELEDGLRIVAKQITYSDGPSPDRWMIELVKRDAQKIVSLAYPVTAPSEQRAAAQPVATPAQETKP